MAREFKNKSSDRLDLPLTERCPATWGRACVHSLMIERLPLTPIRKVHGERL